MVYETLHGERDDHQRSCYGGGGVVKDTTGRGFRCSLDRPAAAKRRLLGFHRGDLSRCEWKKAGRTWPDF
jgi:hypothetical protein